VVLPDGTRRRIFAACRSGPLSPLLANLVLDPLDKELNAAVFERVRR
jgi:hypothetical protein